MGNILHVNQTNDINLAGKGLNNAERPYGSLRSALLDASAGDAIVIHGSGLNAPFRNVYEIAQNIILQNSDQNPMYIAGSENISNGGRWCRHGFENHGQDFTEGTWSGVNGTVINNSEQLYGTGCVELPAAAVPLFRRNWDWTSTDKQRFIFVYKCASSSANLQYGARAESNFWWDFDALFNPSPQWDNASGEIWKTVPNSEEWAVFITPEIGQYGGGTTGSNFFNFRTPNDGSQAFVQYVCPIVDDILWELVTGTTYNIPYADPEGDYALAALNSLLMKSTEPAFTELGHEALRIVPEAAVVTFDNTTNIVLDTAHDFLEDDSIYFVAEDTLPTGLSATTEYFVINVNANDFQVSLTAGGAAVTFSDNGTGTISAQRQGEYVYDDTNLQLNYRTFVGEPIDVLHFEVIQSVSPIRLTDGCDGAIINRSIVWGGQNNIRFDALVSDTVTWNDVHAGISTIAGWHLLGDGTYQINRCSDAQPVESTFNKQYGGGFLLGETGVIASINGVIVDSWSKWAGDDALQSIGDGAFTVRRFTSDNPQANGIELSNDQDGAVITIEDFTHRGGEQNAFRDQAPGDLTVNVDGVELYSGDTVSALDVEFSSAASVATTYTVANVKMGVAAGGVDPGGNAPAWNAAATLYDPPFYEMGNFLPYIPELKTPYLNQSGWELGDSVTIDASINWTNIDENSFTAINLPAGLSMTAQGLITGTLSEGGIIGTTIECQGQGVRNSAGFNWSISL